MLQPDLPCGGIASAPFLGFTWLQARSSIGRRVPSSGLPTTDRHWEEDEDRMGERDPLPATVHAVLIADRPESLVSRRVDAVEVGQEGLSGDKHAGFTRAADGRTREYARGTRLRNDRQVSLVSREELGVVASRLKVAEIQPEWLGANLMLEGIPALSQLPANTRLRFAEGVVLVVQGENMPCAGPGRVLVAQFGRPELEKEFPRAALHLRGVVAVVERAGTLRPGETVVVSLPSGADRQRVTGEGDSRDGLPAGVLSILRGTPGRWEGLTTGVAAELLRLPPAPGEWSALDCLAHLIETEREVFPVRVEALLAGKDFPGFDPDAQGVLAQVADDPPRLAETFSRLRTESLVALSRLTQADLSRTARHAELGIVTLAELLNEWAGHDLMHTIQAERALMQPFIQGCGPWKPYFSDHCVGPR